MPTGPPGWAAPGPTVPGPVARTWPRIGARVLDLIAAVALVAGVLVVAGDGERPFAALALAWLTWWLYETVTVAGWGATPGKLALGLRVVALDTVGRPPLSASARRGAYDAALAVLPVIGWGIWAMGALGAPLRRGPADRAAGTMVVPARTRLPVSTRDLPGYADGDRTPRLTTLGRVGDADVRGRARLRRLGDAPLLNAVVGLLALAAALPFTTTEVILGCTAGWIVVFVVDETIRVHRSGTTAGHRLAGLVIRSRSTGEPPGVGRSLARALVLGLTLYLPVLWPLLAVSVLMMRFGDAGRSLHDVAGGTVVVGDPRLDPEEQRQRAMRIRLGRAG